MKLDLFKSQPHIIGPKQTLILKRDYSTSTEDRSQSEHDFARSASALISVWPRLIALPLQLTEVIEPSLQHALYKESEELFEKYRQFEKDRQLEKLNENFQSVADGVSARDESKSVQHFFTQIKVVSEHLFNVGVKVAAKAGYGLPFAKEISSIDIGSSLLMGAAAIADVFGRQSNPVMPMLTTIVIELASQYQVLLAEMELRGIDLKAQIGEVGIEIVTHFANLTNRMDVAQEELRHLYQQVLSEGIDIRRMLSSVSQSMVQLREMLTDQITTNVIDSISKPIHRIIQRGGGEVLDDTTVRQIVSQLMTSIQETNKRQPVAGAGSAPDPVSMSQWVVSKENAFWSDYHINELRMCAAQHLPPGTVPHVSIGNPLLWSYSTLALLLLYRKQYAASTDRHAKRITTAELLNIQQAIEEGEVTQGLLKRFRDPQLYQSLLASLELSLLQFKTCYREHLTTFETKKAAEIEQDKKQADKEKSAGDVHALKEQVIEPVHLGHKWSNGEHITHHSVNHQRIYASGVDFTSFHTCKKRNEEEKWIYLSKYGFVVYPEPGFDGPILPLTAELVEKIQRSLPKSVTEAVNLNLGVFSYRYCIEGVDRFKLVTYFGETACHNLILKYDPGLFVGAEAIWMYWVSGTVLDIIHWGVSDKRHFDEYFKSKPTGYILTKLSRQDYRCSNRLSSELCQQISAHAKKLVGLKENQLRTAYNEEVRHVFNADMDSPFGRAITNYFAALKCLKAFLALSMHDDYDNAESDLNKLLRASHIPTSREEMVVYLQKHNTKTGLEWLESMEQLVATYKKYLPQILKGLGESSYQLVESVLTEARSFVDDYAPTQVKVNSAIPFTASQDPDVELEKEDSHTAMLMGFMMSLKEEAYGLHLTPEQQERFKESTRSRFETFLGEHSHLAAEAAGSPARLMSLRRDSPVFGQRGIGAAEALSDEEEHDTHAVNKSEY